MPDAGFTPNPNPDPECERCQGRKHGDCSDQCQFYHYSYRSADAAESATRGASPLGSLPKRLFRFVHHGELRCFERPHDEPAKSQAEAAG